MVPMADMLNAKFEHDNVGFLRAFSGFHGVTASDHRRGCFMKSFPFR